MPDDRFGKGTSSTTKATKKGIENIIKQANTAGSQQFLSGNVSASDRRDQITDLANLAQDRGVDFNLNTEEFTGNERGISNADPTGKLREGMTGDEYHLFMRGLHKANPAAMETAFPFSSGAGIRNIATALTPLKYLKALGSGAKEGLANLGHKLAPGLTEALGFHKNKFMNDLSNVGPGLKKEFKKLAGLNSTEESLLNTINKEMTSSQKSAQELLQAGNEDFNEDWTNAILGDAIKDAETTVMDNAEKELALAKEILFGVNDTSQTTAYDPTQDVDTRTSGPDEVEDWMGEIQPRISGALDQTNIFDTSADDQFYKDTWGVTRDQYNKIMTAPENLDVDEGLWSQAEGYDDKWLEDALGYPVYKSKSGRFFKVNPETNYVQMDDDITDEVTKLSMSMRTDTPVSMDEKRNVVAQAYGSDKALDETGTWGNDEINTHYDWIKYKQGQGQEFGDRKRVINPVNPGWQLPGTNELVDQINWNTANAPLDTNQLYPPELTEDFIQDNITTDWGWNKGGYLKKFDDGGYANMSTYEKLKAINDSIAEG